MVSTAQLTGGSFLCCSNFLLNLSPKLFCSLRKEVVVTTFSRSSLFSACLLSLHFYHQIITNFHKATLSDEGNQSTIPQLSAINQYQLIILELCCGVSPFLVTAAVKATFLPQTAAAYPLPRCSVQSALLAYFCHVIIPYAITTLVISASHACPWTRITRASLEHHGLPHSSVPGCFLFCWHTVYLLTVVQLCSLLCLVSPK